MELELMNAVTSMGKHKRIHPTIAFSGEELRQLNFSCSYASFLLNTKIVEVKINQEVVRKETKYLQKYAIVADFIGGKHIYEALLFWV